MLFFFILFVDQNLETLRQFVALVLTKLQDIVRSSWNFPCKFKAHLAEIENFFGIDVPSLALIYPSYFKSILSVGLLWILVTHSSIEFKLRRL